MPRVVGKEVPENDVYQSLFDEKLLIFVLQPVQAQKVGKEGTVEFFVRHERRQGRLFEGGGKVVRVRLFDDEDDVVVVRAGEIGMHGAAPCKDDVVFFGEESGAVHNAFRLSVGDVQHFDAAVEMRLRIGVRTVKTAERFFPVVKGLVNKRIFHNVNIR